MGFVLFGLGWTGFGIALLVIGLVIAKRAPATAEESIRPMSHRIRDAFMLGVLDPTAKVGPGMALATAGAVITAAAVAALALVTIAAMATPGTL